MKISLGITQGIFLGNPILLLIIIGVGSVGLWGTINFLFGGKATYASIFTVWMYAGLPGVHQSIARESSSSTQALLPSRSTSRTIRPRTWEHFSIHWIRTPALYSLASSIDIVTIWTLVLLGMGVAMVAGVKRSSGYIAVFGWWAIFVLIGVGWNAVMS